MIDVVGSDLCRIRRQNIIRLSSYKKDKLNLKIGLNRLFCAIIKGKSSNQYKIWIIFFYAKKNIICESYQRWRKRVRAVRARADGGPISTLKFLQMQVWVLMPSREEAISVSVKKRAREIERVVWSMLKWEG